MKTAVLLGRVAVLLFLAAVGKAGADETPAAGVPDSALLDSAYSREESFRYDVSWSGGIKIGELRLHIQPLAGQPGQFDIHARVTDHGAFRFFYPVDDTFVTRVAGPKRLPLRYEVEQKEGFGYRAKRLTLYDQEGFQVRYRKNDIPEKTFAISGTVHNEFSSFFATRVLAFAPDKSVIVPTFADEKRHEVVVTPRSWQQLDETLLGSVPVIEVLPRMTFKGLYDKSGDTEIWFTDDPCRIPVRIRSKILIGSLTAELVAYQGESCGRRWDLDQEEREKEEDGKGVRSEGD